MLLADLVRLEAWQTAPIPEDLRAHLQEQRRERAVELAELLLAWRRLGGTFALELATGAGPAPVEPARTPDAEEARFEPARIVSLPAAAPVPAAVAAPVDDDETLSTPIAQLIPAPSPAPIPHSPPATLASLNALAGLKAHVEGGGGFRVQAPPTDWPVRLAEQLNELLPAREPEADLAAVLRVVDAMEKWRILPPEVQATLIGLLAARLRFLQEQAVIASDRRLDFAFGTLSAYVKRARPGYVYGLARWHQPNRESWENDAEALFERLSAMLPTPVEAEPSARRKIEVIEGLVREASTCPEEVRSAVEAQLRREVLAAFAAGVQARNSRLVRMLVPVAGAFEGQEFRSLRRAIRDEMDAARADEAEDAGIEEPELPADWAWWPFTKDQRALIVGGDPREPNRLRLERAFGFSELEWVGAEYKRNNLHGVRDRVRSGRVDLVLLLTRFTGHDADQIIIPACREMNVGFVCVPHGYGVVRVRQAIERFLDPEERRR